MFRRLHEGVAVPITVDGRSVEAPVLVGVGAAWILASYISE